MVSRAGAGKLIRGVHDLGVSFYNMGMDNKTVARILRETAELLQIDGAIIGRYRSYEKTAELIAGMHESIEQIAQDPAKLTELPGIGDRMAEHIQEILRPAIMDCARSC